MPTGYTWNVANGEVTDLRTFALQCARGMGALVHMRDDPSGAPIPMRVEADTKYHDEALAEAEARLAELMAMTPAEREAAAGAAYKSELSAYQTRKQEREEQARRYQDMKTKVKNWDGAPEGLKTFMLEQLQQSIAHDCDDSYDERPAQPEPQQWYQDQIRCAVRDLEYHGKERAAEIARAAERNAWLAQLWAGLPPEEKGTAE